MLNKVKNYQREIDEAYRESRKMYAQFFMKFSVNQSLSRIIPPMSTFIWVWLAVYIVVKEGFKKLLLF